MKFLVVVDGLKEQAKAQQAAEKLDLDVIVTDDAGEALEQVDRVDGVVTALQLKLSGGIQMFGGQPLYDGYQGNGKPALGMAIALLAQKRGKPVVIVCSGSDAPDLPYLWFLFRYESTYAHELVNASHTSVFRWGRDWSEALNDVRSIYLR